MNSPLICNQVRRISQAALERLKHIPTKGLVWKANEDDPLRHSRTHEGLFYQLPSEQKLLKIFGHQSPFDIETTKYYKALGTMQLMVRQPALAAIDYLTKLDQSQHQVPNVRMLFYGDKGTGKTHTLTHLLHYLHSKQEHFVIHIREMKKFTRSPWEFCESVSRPGRIDTPINAAILLQQFKVQNANLIEKHKENLKCSRDYKWSQREITKAGDPLISVADHGINRVNHASDCVAVLFKELMLASDNGTIKLASFLDNVKFLYHEFAGVLKHKDLKHVLVDEITVARAIKKLIKGTQKNSVVLATCDDKLALKQKQTPREILGIHGWNDFDPCLPINVSNYSRKEFESCMNFYQDIGWLCRPESKTEQVRDEIRFISGLNPSEVAYSCLSI